MADDRSAIGPPRKAPATRELLRLAWPIFIAQVAVVGNGAIDVAMAGRLSTIDLAAVALGANIYVTIYIALMGVLQALAPIAGEHHGAGRLSVIGELTRQTWWLSGFLAMIGVPLVLATDLWFALAQVDSSVAGVTRSYLGLIAVALPAALAMRVFGTLNVAITRPKVTMLINLAALALKAPLNLVFIQGLGPLPAMGGAGCAAATATLAWTTLAAAALLWRFDPTYRRLRLNAEPLRPRWPAQKALLSLGIPIGVSTFFEVTSFTMLAVLIARIGPATVGAHQIVANLVALLYMVPLALGLATSTLIAQQLGADAPRAARNIALRGFRIVIGVALVAALIIWMLRDGIVGVYTTNAEVAAIAMTLIGLGALFHAFDAAQGIASFILRAYRVALVPMLIYGVALWGIGLAGGFWIAFYDSPLGPPQGAIGFWMAGAFGLACAAVPLVWLAATVSLRHSQAAAITTIP